MTIKKIGNALYIDGDHPVQDAKFYSNLLKNPEVEITARQMKAIFEGKSLSIKIVTEANMEKKQSKNPDQGVSASLIGNTIKRSTKVKLIADEVEDEKYD